MKSHPVSLLRGRQRRIGSVFFFGHLIANCKAWKQKAAAKTKNVAFAQSVSESDFTYGPFILHGTVSFANGSETKPGLILRDTGSAQSFVCKDVLPFSDQSYMGRHVLCEASRWAVFMFHSITFT